MKAVQVMQWGDNAGLKITDIPTPTPAHGEVLIKIAGAGVNPVDWKVREGYLNGKTAYHLPLTLGWELAGTVVAVGNKAAKFVVGDKVYAYQSVLEQGLAYTEYAAVQQDLLAVAPQKISLTEAGAVPLAALTAWQALFDNATVSEGQRVLIHAGAGGVGSFAIQLAKHAGAYVLATGSMANHETLCKLGADEVIDYHQPNHLSTLSPVDVVLDTIGGETLKISYDLVKPGGQLVSIVEQPEDKAGITTRGMLVQPNTGELAEITKLIDSGALKPLVTATYPLAEAAKALDQSQAGHVRGKIVLRIDQ